MQSRLPRWLIITLTALAVAVLLGLISWGGYALIKTWQIIGLGIFLVIIVGLGIFIWIGIKPLIQYYKFNKYYQSQESQLKNLPGLLQAGRTTEALARFEGVMKHAPDSAYIYFMRANFLQSAGKLPEALTAANKALALSATDPILASMLKEAGGQMGQPSTVTEFKAQLNELIATIEPKVTAIRMRREKARREKKKKSR
ncbi:MAG: tetratricopeptide repeat protein [bacterium]